VQNKIKITKLCLQRCSKFYLQTNMKLVRAKAFQHVSNLWIFHIFPCQVILNRLFLPFTLLQMNSKNRNEDGDFFLSHNSIHSLMRPKMNEKNHHFVCKFIRVALFKVILAKKKSDEKA
jgi:hypothetical protein